jgi:SlyX protein
MMTDDRPEHQTQDAQSERLDALEIRVAFLDELLESLNAVVAQQDQQLTALQTQCRMLYQRLDADQKNDIGIEPFDAMSDIPPHY